MTGDQFNMLGRVRALLPPWFGNAGSPVLDALLQGAAAALVFAFDLYAYAALQTRIRTATDGWLDLIAWDFFGVKLRRRTGQADSVFRSRILAALFRPKTTRAALRAILLELTGREPIIFEPSHPADTGGYGVWGVGYGVAGGYGSLLYPFQSFVTAYRPGTSGIPYVAGYGASSAGYGVPSRGCYCDLSQIAGEVTDADIYQAIESTRPVGYQIWTRIES